MDRERPAGLEPPRGVTATTSASLTKKFGMLAVRFRVDRNAIVGRCG